MYTTTTQQNIIALVELIKRISLDANDTVSREEALSAFTIIVQQAIIQTVNEDDNLKVYVAAGAKATPAFVDNEDGSITCQPFTCILYDNETFQGNPKEYLLSESTFELTDGGSQYIYAGFDGGVPEYMMTDNIDDINGSNNVLIFKVWRVGTTIHSFDTDANGSGLVNKIEKMLYDTVLYQRSVNGWLIISEKTTPNPRTITVSDAKVYVGKTPVNVFYFDSSSNEMFEMVSTSEGWTQTQVSVYDNTHINVAGAGKTAMTTDYYKAVYFYRSIGDDRNIFYTIGEHEYKTSSEAELCAERTDIPALIKGHCLLVGRSIIKNGATSGSISSPFTATFLGSSVINHNDTGNIQGGTSGEYNHLTNAQVLLLNNLHTQGTDQGLDTGGANAVTAAQAKTAYTNNHTHSNKSTLDLITAAFTTSLKSAYDSAATWVTTYGADTHTHSNKTTLDLITAAFTTSLKSAYDGAVTWISTNGSNLVNHLSNTSNPHTTTHSQLGSLNGGGDYHLSQTDYTDKITNRRFGDVSGGNYSEFESDGTLKFVGNATVWKDIDFPIIIRTSGGNIPTLTTFVGNLTLPIFAVNDFAVLEAKEFIHAWKEGSDTTFHIHLVTNGTNVNDRAVKFEVEYTYQKIGSAFGASNTVVSTEMVIPANTPTRTHLLYNITTFTPIGITIASQVIARLRRITAAGTAPTTSPWVMAFQMHVECDTFGSRIISTK